MGSRKGWNREYDFKVSVRDSRLMNKVTGSREIGVDGLAEEMEE